MHRIDTTGNVANLFNEGDPLVPRLPTQVDKHWLNAIQEELVGVVLDAGISLVKGTNTQLLAALKTILVNRTTTQAIDGLKSFLRYVAITGGAADTWALSANANAGSTNGNAFAAVAIGTGTAVAANSPSGIAVGATAGGLGTTLRAINTGTGYAAWLESPIATPNRSAVHIEPQGANPTSAVMGDLYVNSGTGKLMIYTGSAWVVVGTQT